MSEAIVDALNADSDSEANTTPSAPTPHQAEHISAYQLMMGARGIGLRAGLGGLQVSGRSSWLAGHRALRGVSGAHDSDLLDL